jgi:hypothetical protein
MPRKLTISSVKATARAQKDVIAELRQYGCWTESLAQLKVRHSWCSWSYGYQRYGGDGDIVIPMLSGSRLVEQFSNCRYVSLRDVLRHEYAHGIAYCHNHLVSKRLFTKVFGAPHDSDQTVAYCDQSHVTAYAASHPMEDFAEVFMYFLKYKGKLPRRWSGFPRIVKKWKYIESLCRKLRRMN